MIRFICLLIMPFFLFAGNSKFPWVVYYGENNINASKLFPFNPIVLDSNNPPPIQELLDKKKDVLGYLAITEIPESDSEYLEALEKKLLIEENPNFLKSWSVDIRNPLWKKIVLEKKIPKILGKGFNGFFLDQVDVALALEIKNPKKYARMKVAAIDLIKSIKESFPDKKIMLNNYFLFTSICKTFGEE